MEPQDYNEEVIESARRAWNILSELLCEDSKFEEGEEFKTFYLAMMSKLLEEGEEE